MGYEDVEINDPLPEFLRILLERGFPLATILATGAVLESSVSISLRVLMNFYLASLALGVELAVLSGSYTV